MVIGELEKPIAIGSRCPLAGAYYIRQRLPDHRPRSVDNGTLAVAIRGFYAPDRLDLSNMERKITINKRQDENIEPLYSSLKEY